MNSKNSLLLQKTPIGAGTSSNIKDLEEYFHAVTLYNGVPSFSSVTSKELAKTSWPGENGDDVYFGSKTYLESFDWTVRVGIKDTSADNVESKIYNLVHWLTNDVGVNGLTIYSAWLGEGRQNMAFSELGEIEWSAGAEGLAIAQFDLTFHVFDPWSKVAYNPTSGLYIEP